MNCSVCGTIVDSSGHRYCKACKARYMRDWRKTHPQTVEQKRRQNARAYLHVYVKRGKIVKKPCQVCQSPDSEAHHADYTKPLEVVWLCRDHHLELHAKQAI